MPDSLEHFLAATTAYPAVQVLIVILATFILEDAATVLTAIQVKLNALGPFEALIALYVGIVLGDVGLYGMGYLAARWPPARRWVNTPERDMQRQWLTQKLFKVVFISRFIPGTRLPLYTACGFFNAGLRTFTLATLAATLIWTSALFALSLHIGGYLLAHLGAWRWAGILGFVLVFIIMGRIVARMQKQGK
ncbi:DedA family protein [Acetobacter senegalensis]|uniref:DedA family protein n=1 Tax=Acetobacter senegalensis TaxID=446692 RepID=UPI001EDA6340|nr:VTT domain-containing protein [Acetobacter senegalensis]MCG4271864.1 VTT domain-containing protein [Acetobacter senegalensis]